MVGKEVELGFRWDLLVQPYAGQGGVDSTPSVLVLCQLFSMLTIFSLGKMRVNSSCVRGPVPFTLFS